MKNKIICLIVFIYTCFVCPSQQLNRSVAQQDSFNYVHQSITTKEVKDAIYFYAPPLPPLGHIAGAPPAFYSYFWELGDGSFSYDEVPSHTYREPGIYTVHLFVTNNFDNGKAPSIPPLEVIVKKEPLHTVKKPSYFFDGSIEGNIGMKNNRDPVPGEDFVTLLGYRNRQVDNLHASLVLFYNEKDYGNSNFELIGQRVYNGERPSTLNNLLVSLEDSRSLKRNMYALQSKEPKSDEEKFWANNSLVEDNKASKGRKIFSAKSSFSPEYESYLGKGNKKSPGAVNSRSLLQTLKKEYTSNRVFRFDSLKKGDEKFIFMTMKASEKMLQDTDATITLTALMIPDDPLIQPEKYELQMQVVSSHDPNKFMLPHNRIRYRFFSKNKDLNYQVHFENIGKGPARNVSLSIAIPPQLNAATLQLKRIRPVCPWCSTTSGNQSCVDTMRNGDSLYVNFRNIYIPGIQQKSVKDKDSTRGFVEYGIRFKRKPKKIPFGTRAKIVFDKNEPMYTNKAMARFQRGLSPGIMAGYNLSLANGAYSAKGPAQIGYTIAPFSPYRPYFQAEAFLGFFAKEDSVGTTLYDSTKSPNYSRSNYRVKQQEYITTHKRTYINITPIHLRYNLNNWIGVGIGGMVQFVISEEVSHQQIFNLWSRRYSRPDSVLVLNGNTEKDNSKFISKTTVAAFADLQIGKVRNGPTVGIRYLRWFKGNILNQLYVYAALKI